MRFTCSNQLSYAAYAPMADEVEKQVQRLVAPHSEEEDIPIVADRRLSVGRSPRDAEKRLICSNSP